MTEQEAKAFANIVRLFRQQQDQIEGLKQALGAVVVRMDELEKAVQFAKAVTIAVPRHAA